MSEWLPDWYSEPHWGLAVLFLLVGFALLLKGADLLVEGGVAIARRVGLSTAVIGATIVAFGTSLPELVVTLGSGIKAISQGAADDPQGPIAIAVGNIVGSNIFNMGAILGLSAIVRRLPVPRSTLRLDYPLMMLALVLLIVFSAPIGGAAVIGRVEGGFLLLGLIAFTALAVKFDKVPPHEVESIPVHSLGPGAAVALIVLGILMLAVGGDVSLNGAIALAERMGMGERVIGLTIMAIGTSLPELATSIQAARRGHTDIAVGNVVGSNLFNVLCIVGITSLVVPLPVAKATLYWDYWWMLGINLTLLPLFLFGRSIGRFKGLLLVLMLVVYLTLVLAIPGIGG